MKKINNISKSAQKNREFSENFSKYLENKKYEALLEAEAQQENRKSLLNSMAKNSVGKYKFNSVKKFSQKLSLREALTTHLFIEGIVNIFYEAVVLDEDFKEKSEDEIKDYAYDKVSETLAKKGEKETISEAAPVIQKFYTLCQKLAECETDEMCKDDKDSCLNKIPEINGRFILSEKDKNARRKDFCDVQLSKDVDETYNEYINKLTNSVSNVIKDKVISVVKDETEKAKTDEDLTDEINEKLNANKDADNSLDTSNTMNDEEKKALNNSLDVHSVSEGFNFSLVNKSAIKRNSKGITNCSLFKSIMTNVSNQLINESTNNNIEMDMDMIFAESILVYTMLETLNTTKLYKVGPIEGKKLVDKFLVLNR